MSMISFYFFRLARAIAQPSQSPTRNFRHDWPDPGPAKSWVSQLAFCFEDLSCDRNVHAKPNPAQPMASLNSNIHLSLTQIQDLSGEPNFRTYPILAFTTVCCGSLM